MTPLIPLQCCAPPPSEYYLLKPHSWGYLQGWDGWGYLLLHSLFLILVHLHSTFILLLLALVTAPARAQTPSISAN